MSDEELLIALAAVWTVTMLLIGAAELVEHAVLALSRVLALW